MNTQNKAKLINTEMSLVGAKAKEGVGEWANGGRESRSANFHL